MRELRWAGVHEIRSSCSARGPRVVQKSQHFQKASKAVEMNTLQQSYCTDHRDPLSYVTLLGDDVGMTRTKSTSATRFVLRPMSVEVVPSRSLTEAVRDASPVFLRLCYT